MNDRKPEEVLNMSSIISFPTQMARTLRQLGWRQRLASLGEHPDIRPNAHFEHPRNIMLGSRCCVSRHATLRANTAREPGIRLGDRTHIGEYSLVAANRGWVNIGDDSWVGSHCSIQGNGGVSIGNHVMIASLCAINTVSHRSDRLDLPMNQQGTYCDPVIIEDDVWIGIGAIILQGVRIGQGSIVAAGAVVNRNLPPNSIAMGVPARAENKRAEMEVAENPSFAASVSEASA
jgi:acetyltransferase-like isoleucine patch superfamily enzyme